MKCINVLVCLSVFVGGKLFSHSDWIIRNVEDLGLHDALCVLCYRVNSGVIGSWRIARIRDTAWGGGGKK
jgi:hypothetical protein